MDEMTAKIEGWIDTYQGDPKDGWNVVKSFMSMCMTRKSLLAEIRATQARLTAYNGIDAMQEIAMASQKAKAVGRTKIELNREAKAEAEKPLPPANPGSRDAAFAVDVPTEPTVAELMEDL